MSKPAKIRRYILRKYETNPNTGELELTEIRVDRLADGQLRIDTDRIPEATHDKADQLVKHLITAAGGEHKCEHKEHGDHTHLHVEHVHDVEHEHN